MLGEEVIFSHGKKGKKIKNKVSHINVKAVWRLRETEKGTWEKNSLQSINESTNTS